MSKWSTVFVAGLIGAAMIAQANAAMIVPAKYASGVATAVDVAKGELTVGEKTYRADPSVLKDVQAGNELQIQYFDQDGQLRAMWITVPTREPEEKLLVD